MVCLVRSGCAGATPPIIWCFGSSNIELWFGMLERYNDYMVHISSRVGTLEGCVVCCMAQRICLLQVGRYSYENDLFYSYFMCLVHDTSEIILQESGPKGLSIR